MSSLSVIVPPRRARVSAIACGGVTALFVAGAVGFLMETQLSSVERYTASSLCLFMALGVGALALRLGIPRGGIYWDESRDAIGLGLTGRHDIWWLERAACQGIVVTEPDPDQTTDLGLFGVVLARSGAPPVLLVETPDPELTKEAARSLEAGLKLPALERLPDWQGAATPEDAIGWVRVSRRVALHRLMIAMGSAALGIGGILVSQVASHPIVSIFIAPVALLTGLLLITMPLVKRLGAEELQRAGGRWRYRWRLFGLAWGDRDLPAKESCWRVRVGEGGGARLELVTDEGEIWLGSGANAHSQITVEDLSRFPKRFLKGPSAG